MEQKAYTVYNLQTRFCLFCRRGILTLLWYYILKAEKTLDITYLSSHRTQYTVYCTYRPKTTQGVKWKTILSAAHSVMLIA